MVANAELIDGIAGEVQFPTYQPAALAQLQMTAPGDDTDLEVARQRFIDWRHSHKHRLHQRKRTESTVEIARPLQAEGPFPHPDQAFDQGVLSVPLTPLIERQGKHWGSELECSRHIQWQGQWHRVDAVEAQLCQPHPDSFRPLQVSLRNSAESTFWVFTNTVRLKRQGHKRLVIVHAHADLQDQPRLLLTEALHWESARVIRVWSQRSPGGDRA